MFAVVIAAAGCVTTDQLAPPADEVIRGLLSARGADALTANARDQVTLGRLLYITDCADCHSPEPVLAHSMIAWEEILPRMAQESKLSDEETEAIRAYVAAVHAWGGVAQ